MKTLILKNFFLTSSDFGMERVPSFQEWLISQKLHGKESRSRTRFLKLLNPRIDEIEKERQELLATYVKKDADGNRVYLDKDNKETKEDTGRVVFTDEDKMNNEYRAYMSEDFIIDVTPSNSEFIYAVRDILLNSNEEFSGVASARYDELATAFEKIGEAKEVKTKK